MVHRWQEGYVAARKIVRAEEASALEERPLHQELRYVSSFLREATGDSETNVSRLGDLGGLVRARGNGLYVLEISSIQRSRLADLSKEDLLVMLREKTPFTAEQQAVLDSKVAEWTIDAALISLGNPENVGRFCQAAADFYRGRNYELVNAGLSFPFEMKLP